MVKTKIISVLMLLAAFCVTASALDRTQDWSLSWKRIVMDGSRTGCRASTAENVPEAIGSIENGKYFSPGGRAFTGTVADVAAVVLAAQPVMKEVKAVIGHSKAVMEKAYPESALSNLFIDVIMDKVEDLADEDVDVGIANFGGIRIDMPEGDILLDDILSMFPFRNNVVYLKMSGKDLMDVFRYMASTEFQVLGGVRIRASEGKIVSATIDGEDIDEDKVYGVATISFLLDGGDGLYLAKTASDVRVFPEEIKNVMLEYVNEETAAGRSLEYKTDGRVSVEN